MITRSTIGVFKPKSFQVQTYCLEPTFVKDALANSNWSKAMTEELESLLRNNTWSLVPYTSKMNIVDNKWVFHVKHNSDGSIQRYKAPLVAKGLQHSPHFDYFETFNPIIKPFTIRVILTLAVSLGWDIQQVDINNTFLNGNLKETVFMRQPEGFVDSSKPGYVCKLQNALYGLKQTPRGGFEKLKGALLSWGFVNSVSDNSPPMAVFSQKCHRW